MKKAEIRKLMEEQTEENSFVELLKTSNHYFNGFEKRLSQIEDPRHNSYTDYPIEEIVYPVILKNIFNLNSMREIETALIPETAVGNLRKILKTENSIRRIDRGFSPSYVTINDCFEEMDETSGIKFHGIIREGSPAKTILEVAKEEDIDLIVIGSSGKSGFDRFIMGSVAEKVVNAAKCAVLVIH